MTPHTPSEKEKVEDAKDVICMYRYDPRMGGGEYAEMLDKVIDNLLLQRDQEWIKRIESIVPEKLPMDKDGLVERFVDGVDMWGREYADNFNNGSKMWNACRQAILNKIKTLKH
mgnify:CR=1 FL=1